MNTNHKTTTMAAIVTLASLSLFGCGSGQSERKVADPSAARSAVEPFTAVAQAADAGQAAGTPQGPIAESVAADSLPPDVAASAADSVASPGATVEFTAQASADAVEVFLWDGIGRKQSFTYDSTANVWRARYRVPLSAAAGRTGIAVTAKNGLGLRSRVWVFVRIERQASADTPEKSDPAPNAGQ